MMVSTKGRYALRVMLDLAANGKDTCVSLRDIANRQEISLKYLEAVIAILNRAGLVTSRMGKMVATSWPDRQRTIQYGKFLG